MFIDDVPGREFDMGQTAVFEVGKVTILVSEHVGIGGNHPDVYRGFGIEPADYKMVVVKTASNFQYYAPITSRVIRVNTTGPTQSDIVEPALGADPEADLPARGARLLARLTLAAEPAAADAVPVGTVLRRTPRGRSPKRRRSVVWGSDHEAFSQESVPWRTAPTAPRLRDGLRRSIPTRAPTGWCRSRPRYRRRRPHDARLP